MSAILLVVVVLLLAVFAHEAGHALAMRQLGIPLAHAGIGLPLPPQWTVHRRGITWSISPWLVGAFVGTDESGARKLETLSRTEKAWWFNAGVIVNLVGGFALQALAALLLGKLLLALVLATVAAAVWLWRHAVAAYVLPALAAPALALFIYLLIDVVLSGRSPFGFAGLDEVAPADLTIAAVAQFAGAISLALAFMNMIPLGPLDNGKAVGDLMERWGGDRVRRRYDQVGYLFVGLATAAALGSDLVALVGAVW